MILEISKYIYDEIFQYLHLSNIDLFLCGGASDKKHTTTRDFLRKKLEKNEKISILYPEDLFMELLNRKKYDLLTLESFLAQNSDIIIIACESPGSFAELGAFVNNKDTFKKVVVLMQTKYKNKKSFISLGPVKYVSSYNKENVIYYNQNHDNLERDVNNILKKKFWFLGYKMSKSRKIKDLDLITGQYHFIILLVYFYKSIESNELTSCVKSLYIEKNYDEENFDLIYRAALKRMYKDGLLIKKADFEGYNYYSLTHKGYNKARNMLDELDIVNRDKKINMVRLKILYNQYY